MVCMLPLRDIVIFGEVSRSLRQVEREFTRGKMVFPLGPTLDCFRGSINNVVEVEKNSGLCRKSSRPGMATLLGNERLDVYTCYWEVRVETFQGVRLEIGVGSRGCVATGGLNANECWVFDCFGRAKHAGRIRGYGCKIHEGDIVGVLLDATARSLSFFLNGICMGTAFRNVRFLDGRGLYPLVVLPSITGEAIQLCRWPGSSISFPASSNGLLDSKKDWKPSAHKHPDDRHIIVETSDPQVLFRIGGLDPYTTTVGMLKEELVGLSSDMENFVPGQLALRTRGSLLTDDSMLLSAVGVTFGLGGAQLLDIFLYVPHLIS
ncbi:unnamed protein product [Discosporangium mesarthrocarpum]